MVLADSHGIPRAPHYSGTSPEPRHRGTAYTTITHYGRPSQGVRLPRQHGTTPRQRGNRPAPQHPARNGRRLSHARGLAIIRFRSPLLTEYLFLRVLRCFTSPRSPHHPIHVQMMVAQHNPGRVPPFGHPRIKARSPTPRGISQAATSFISSWCQGIHRMPHKTTQQKTRPHAQPPTKKAGPGPRATRPPPPREHGTQQNTRGRAQTTKMLATTIQITNNPPPAPHRPATRNSTAQGPQPPTHAPPTTKERARTGVGSEPDSAPARPQHIKPHAQPHNEDAPHQHNTSGTHAPPSTTTPPAPTPPRTGGQKDRRRAAPQNRAP